MPETHPANHPSPPGSPSPLAPRPSAPIWSAKCGAEGPSVPPQPNPLRASAGRGQFAQRSAEVV